MCFNKALASSWNSSGLWRLWFLSSWLLEDADLPPGEQRSHCEKRLREFKWAEASFVCNYYLQMCEPVGNCRAGACGDTPGSLVRAK